MLKENLNLESDSNSVEDVKKILQEGMDASEDLRAKLSHIKININKTEESVIKAIRELFGDSYISSSGNSIITYDMYCSTINLIRTLGAQKASEML